MKSFERFIQEAELMPFEGWDFSFLQGRLVEAPTPWDYAKIVGEQLQSSDSLVDIGTGGGELLSSLHPLPPRTVATEGYRPNVAVARRRLGPLGVDVVQTYCDDNTRLPQRGALPFRDDSIGLVADRHESFIAKEVFRVLRPSGRFVTQQVGDSNFPELNRALGADEPPTSARWNLAAASEQLEAAGFTIADSRQARLEARFHDVGAVVSYLRAVPWQVPDFSVEGYRHRLLRLDAVIRRDGSFRVTFPRFLVQAVKPH